MYRLTRNCRTCWKLTLFFVFAFACAVSAAEQRPNVIFMLTDDLGYSDVGCYGATKVKTPHIDRLAAEGVRFTDFHTAASICSPSAMSPNLRKMSLSTSIEIGRTEPSASAALMPAE